MNRIKLVLVMVLWGSLGVFTRSIPLSALSLAFLRALIALPVLFAALKMKNTEKVEWRLLKPYIISGSILGFGWLTLFYGYKHTSISSAVILYNMCPVYVMIAAPLLLKEAISKIQIAVVFFSFLGLVLIVGQNLSEGYGYLGMALSAVSGMLYATIILINRSIKSRVDNQTGTFVQISAAIIYTILLGVLHTGIVYTIFFSLTTQMRSVEIVLYSYLEPLFGILFSVIFIGEKLTVLQIIGGTFILGSTFIGEILKNKKKPALPSAMQT